MAKSFDHLAKRVMSRKARARAAARTQELLAEMLLSEVRRLSGKTQRDLARQLGIKQPSLSKLESQDDMQISTLKKIVAAMGGEVRITASFPAGDVRIKQFDGKRNASKKPRQIQLV